jgi:hypothetical protein
MTPAEHCAAALATLNGHHDLIAWVEAMKALRDHLPDVLCENARLRARNPGAIKSGAAIRCGDSHV